jgi:MscS family membrane protein
MMETVEWREIAWALFFIVTAVLLSLVVRSVLANVKTKLLHRTNTTLDDLLIKAIALPARMVIIVWGVELGLSRLTIMVERWSSEMDSAFFAAYVVIVYILFYRLIDATTQWYGDEVAHRTTTDLDSRFLLLFRRVAFLIITISLIIILLDRFGVEVSGLVATLGIGSLAIALAAQATLGDMFAGFTIMVDQPYVIGDRIEIRDIDTWGDVIDIGLRTTRILTRDNRMVSVPNSVIGKGLVVNYSHPSSKYRVETNVGIAYGTDIEFARQVMIEAIKQQDWVMKEERIEALFLTFGDSALEFKVRCWIEHFVETRRVVDKMNTALYQALNEAGIVIPFPQRDLHLYRTKDMD